MKKIFRTYIFNPDRPTTPSFGVISTVTDQDLLKMNEDELAEELYQSALKKLRYTYSVERIEDE